MLSHFRPKSVLFIGDFCGPITGQVIAFKKVYEEYKHEKYLLNNNFLINYKFNFLFFIKNYCLFLFHIYKLCKSTKIDYIYMTISRSFLGSFKDIPVILFGKLFSIPIVCHIHGSDFNLFLNKIPFYLKPLYLYFYKSVKKYIVLCNGMLIDLNVIFNNKSLFHIVPNFYDSIYNDINITELQKTKSESNFIEVVYFSNLLFSKGILYLIDAFINVNEKSNGKFKLNIAGDFVKDDFMNSHELKNIFLNKIYLRDDIIYHGLLIGKKKINLLKKSNIFILPTFYLSEAQPLSIIEALRMGCYIISTKFRYIPEFINCNNGELILPNSSASIEVALNNYLLLSSNEKSKILINNVNYATNKFSLYNYLNGVYSTFE